MSDWRKEFGVSWSVPARVDDLVDKGDLVDMSWHNDVAPSFITKSVAESKAWEDDGRGVRLWVDHPVRTLREHEDGSRYFVAAGDGGENDVRYAGDDLDEALRVLMSIPPVAFHEEETDA